MPSVTDRSGTWSAPGRVNLIGEHTDYNEGLVLPIALPHRTYAVCSRRDDDLLRVTSAQVGETVEVALADVSPERPGGWAAYAAGVLWAMRADGLEVHGLDVELDSEVPVGAGLSSSAALECSVAAAASDLWGLGLLADDAGRARLARLCVRAENDVALAPTGGMDQAASLRCRAGHALLLDCRSGEVEHVPVDFAAHGLTLLVVDTKAHHALVDGQYASRREACERAAARLGIASLRALDPGDLDAALPRLDDDEQRRRVRHVVTEIERVRQCVAALRADDYPRVGELFTASHASLRDDYEVSVAELDTVVDVALAHGALGARMTGGGFGGSAIVLAPTDRAEAIEAAVRQAYATAGWSAPETFTATASEAARRDG